MNTFKSIIASAALISGTTLGQFSYADDADDALNMVIEKTQSCQSTDIGGTGFDIDAAIADCLLSVIGLSTVAAAALEVSPVDMDLVYQMTDTAATSSMMAAALFFKKAGDVTPDACSSTGTAITYYEANAATAAKNKADSGANTLAGLCRDKGYSLD